MSKVYDLVIVGGGCVGVAAAYYAREKGWNVCIIESQGFFSSDRYWSSSFSARQNRLQYSEEYLTRYVIESNKEWQRVEKHFSEIDQTSHKFLHKEGALWFGDKSVTTNEGNIKAANAVITLINSDAENKEQRLDSLYMEKLMEGSPSFMRAFKPVNPQNSAESEWDAWSALYQPDGGSVDMHASYLRFFKYGVDNGVVHYENTTIKSHSVEQGVHNFSVINPNGVTNILGQKILLTVGVWTPYFLRDVMGEPHLADNAKDEFLLQEYVASYMRINTSDGAALPIYADLPNFYNFIDETMNIETKQQEFSGYGFRFHEWDNFNQTENKFIKMGTMCNHPINEEYLRAAKYGPITNLEDDRIKAAQKYVKTRMNYLIAEDPQNKHYPCPIIFYNGRETLLDYLNRTDETIVVQSGGWIGKYYPLLAKTAILMLEDPQRAQQLRAQEDDVFGAFINRTRFPITSRVRTILGRQVSVGKTHFSSTIVGAGCSGLYAAYRLNQAKHENTETVNEIGNIGVFELSDRISGRLKSFKFMNTTTPMELGGMRYIPTNHVLVNTIITDLGIPHLKFSMEGDPIQNAARMAFLRNDYYRMNQWSTLQESGSSLHTAYRTQGPIVGMDSFQIISFSLYMILTAPENVNLLTEVFLNKTDLQIADQKNKMGILGENVPAENSYYRQWGNFVYRDKQNQRNYFINLSLRQWNQLKPVLLFRFRYPIKDKHVYLGQEQVVIGNTYPLYKFGFQNVIEAQFGHEAYQFVAEQNGYFSNTSNASYLDQTMTYLLDFGNVSYRTLASGFDQINYAIANVLLDNPKGLDRQTEGIFLNHKLVDILPGKQYGKNYVLVFHVPVSAGLKALHYQSKLNACQKKRHQKLSELGRLVPIEGNPGYAEIRFTADRVILGMPRKSVTNLFNEVELLRRPIKEQYDSVFQEQKNFYQGLFQYKTLSQFYAKGQETKPLSIAQQKQLNDLQEKQRKSFMDPPQGPALTPEEKATLDRLSEVNFLISIKDLSTDERDFQNSKLPRFNEDLPLAPTDLQQLAESTQLMPAMKIVMNFDRSWWNPDTRFNKKYQETYKNTNLISSVEEMRGVSVTDLPARQTLYFSSGSDNLLLASYNDMITTEFWTTLHENFSKEWQPKNKRCRTVVLRDAYPKSMDIHPAKEVLVREILKQLSLMHQTEVKEEWVRECIYQFWGRDPYGAGYHNFNSGYYIPAVMKTMRKPWAEESIHIVGEAYSNETGWVEGAYQTTELLLQEVMRLRPLVPNYYAGY